MGWIVVDDECYYPSITYFSNYHDALADFEERVESEEKRGAMASTIYLAEVERSNG